MTRRRGRTLSGDRCGITHRSCGPDRRCEQGEPESPNAGQSGNNFTTATAALDACDPYRIFSNTFLDSFLP